MAKQPAKTDKGQYIGVELEFFALATRDIQVVFRGHGIARYAEMGRDNSIHPPEGNYQSAELRILCEYKELADCMSTLQDFLNTVKAKTNASCGLHVHLDMRNQDASKAYANLIARQDEMYKSIPARRRTNQYCSKTSEKKAAKIIAALSRGKINKSDVSAAMKEMLTKFGATSMNNSFDVERMVDRIFSSQQETAETDHWDGISANPILTEKYLTLEIRLHEATTNANEIRRWVRYLYESAFNGDLSSLSTKYINERLDKHG